MARTQSASILRDELERNIQSGRCVYCRRPAAPDEPLTREHVIPRAKGGRRKDVRIIVPACAPCNHRRGCQELSLFLLLRPRRISAFLDYLDSLSGDSVRQLDLRIFAELYAALWMLRESAARGREWREQLRRMCGGRTLHRRRYAARRVVGEVGGRLEQRRDRGALPSGPSCLLPHPRGTDPGAERDEALERLATRLLGVLSLVWQVPAEEVQTELARQVRPEAAEEEPGEGVVVLDGWKRRHRQRRLRIDRRRRGSTRQARGRAA